MLRKLETYYILWTTFCDTGKYEQMEMDTDSLYSEPTEKELYDWIGNENMQECETLRSKDWLFCSLQTFCRNGFQPRAVLNTQNLMEESLDCPSKELDALKCCVCLAKHIFVTTPPATSVKLAGRNWKTNIWRQWRWPHGKISKRFWTKQKVPIVSFAQRALAWKSTNRQRKHSFIFIWNDLLRQMDTLLFHWNFKYYK